jgi:hypothetical protein
MIASASWGHWDVTAEQLALVVGTVLPLVVGLITKLEAPSWLKALVLAFLAGVAGYLTNVASVTGQVEFWPVVGAGLLAAVAAWGSYQSLWKPTKVAPKVQESTPRFGIGPRRQAA